MKKLIALLFFLFFPTSLFAGNYSNLLAQLNESEINYFEIEQSIEKAWTESEIAQTHNWQGEHLVFFELSMTGRPYELEVLDSSYSDLEKAACDAILAASPFPIKFEKDLVVQFDGKKVFIYEIKRGIAAVKIAEFRSKLAEEKNDYKKEKTEREKRFKAASAKYMNAFQTIPFGASYDDVINELRETLGACRRNTFGGRYDILT